MKVDQYKRLFRCMHGGLLSPFRASCIDQGRFFHGHGPRSALQSFSRVASYFLPIKHPHHRWNPEREARRRVF